MFAECAVKRMVIIINDYGNICCRQKHLKKNFKVQNVDVLRLTHFLVPCKTTWKELKTPLILYIWRV